MENRDFDNSSGNDIAVIGMSCRFPGASNIEEFWKNLSEGVESITQFSDEELEKQGVNPAVLNDPAVIKAAARIDGVDLFDASFFGYSPREAEAIDPQQRIFLECAHEALESAGHDPDRFEGLIGVYGGSGVNTYLMRILAQPAGDAAQNLNATVGNDKDYLCTRVSYKLNLRGPSICVQTACSTSLVAIHLACQGLLDYECDMALAGGVSVRAPQPLFYRYLEGSIMSPDGHCRAFDADAKGTVFGNGAGVVALRRMEDALKDGDNILAVVKGSAINNDGAAKVGYTAPGIEGHVDVIRTAWARANVDPTSISFIEAHGTGTPLGDPIEISALTQAFRAKTSETSFCALGSVKTNIGHLDTAAGVAGIIKAILALNRGHIPPSLNFRSPNPQLNLERTPFFVNTRLRKWESSGPRRAGVSSLGIGGTNAHVVLEEAPRQASSSSWSKYQLLTLSAKTESALESMTDQVYEHYRQHPDLSFPDVAFTWQTGRKQLAHRRVILCNQNNSSCLPESGSAEIFTGTVRKSRPRVVFMFPGQGSQYPQMARELYEAHPVFRKSVDAQLAFLKSEFNFDMRSVIFPAAERLESSPKELNQTALAQPALFIIEYALAQLLISWGIRPDAMIGHSLGEFVAACLAGVFSVEQALRVVVNRGRLMQQQAPGAMLAVPLNEDAVNKWLGKDMALAVVNGPNACVVSGTFEAIQELKDRLGAEGIKSQGLETSHAYHSQMMDPALAPFQATVARERLQVPLIPYASNVTGEWIQAAQATDPAYWAKQLRETVRFGKSIAEVLKTSNTVLVEIGPGHALSSSCKQQDRDVKTFSTLPSRSLHDSGKSDIAAVLTAVGKLWIEGVSVQWEALHQDEQRHRLPVPTYPFERQRYWIGGDQPLTPVTQTGMSREAIDDWFYVPVWQQTPPLSALPQRNLPQDGCWLLLMDECGVGDLVLEHLESAGEKVVVMRTSSDHTKGHSSEYVFSSRSKENLGLLLKELSRSKLSPHTVVNLWTVSKTPAQSAGTRALQEFTSLVESAQAISAAARDAAVEVFIVSNGFCDFAGSEQVCSEKAPLLAAAQVISQECPGLQCRCIQLPNGWHHKISSQQVSELVNEMKHVSHVPVVAHEFNHRWIQTYSKASLPHYGIDKTPLKKGGTYLITGGLGGLGLILAEFLARELQARLVLVNSSSFPTREMWNAQLSKSAEEDRLRAQITKLVELESMGSKVLVLSADVSDKEQVESAFLAVSNEFGKIDGIFHLAGVPGAGLVQFKDREASSKVFRPKVLGTEVLTNAAQSWSVDFLLIFSSITSVTGGIGQVDYSAASRFVEAVAQNSKQNSQVRTISVAWDAWASDTWQDPGLAAFPKLRDMLKQRRKQYGITASEGVDVLQRVLASSLSSVIVSTQDLEKAIESHDRYSRSIVKDQLSARAEAKATPVRSASRSGYVSPRNPLEEQVAELWEKILGVHPVGIHDDFIELGGHSLLAIELTARLRETFQTDMPLKAIFECRTVASLAAMISKEKPGSSRADVEALLAEIEKLSPEEVQAQIQHLQQ